MDGRGNWKLGGPGTYLDRLIGYRFRAGTSSALTSIRFALAYWSTSYSGGNGGTIEITVQTDDGSANHSPSGTILATDIFTPGNPPATEFPLRTFSTPPTLAAGKLYHLVFRNIDPDPLTNYMSVNEIHVNSPTTPMQPKVSDLDWALERKPRASDPWQIGSLEREHTPVLDLGYASGYHEGVGYEYSFIQDNPVTIAGSTKVRERFTVSGSTRTVERVYVRLRQASLSADPLTIRLETGTGTLVEEGTIPAAAVQVGSYAPEWVSYAFSTPRALASGSTYDLVLSAPTGSTYVIYGISKGPNHGFASATYFADGYGQYTTGGSWTGWDGTNADLQFFFR